MSGNDTVYYFDCLDGSIGERYLSLEELKDGYYGAGYPHDLTEKDARAIARNLEAALYRCTVDGGEVTESTCIYDPWDCFG